MGQHLAEESDASFMASACIKCGSQHQYVSIEAPDPGHDHWSMTATQARQLARELERLADEVEAENGSR
jgi:hypothetical protein